MYCHLKCCSGRGSWRGGCPGEGGERGRGGMGWDSGVPDIWKKKAIVYFVNLFGFEGRG